jgi:hypothetical protein
VVQLAFLHLNDKASYAEHYAQVSTWATMLLKGSACSRIVSVTSCCNSDGKRVTFMFFVAPSPTSTLLPSSGGRDGKTARAEFRVLSFNTWCGGGKSLEMTVEVVRSSGSDVVGLQEMPTCMACFVAAVLGWYWHASSGIISRFPLSDIVHPISGAVLSRSASVALTPSLGVNVFNCHAAPYPYPPYLYFHEKLRADKVVASERNVQLASLKDLFDELGSTWLPHSLDFLTGDFNAASHLDYSGNGPDLPSIPFPTSQAVQALGFTDSYFSSPSHTRPHECGSDMKHGLTWSPRPEEERLGIHDRIDFVYVRNRDSSQRVKVAVFNSVTIDNAWCSPYPSDHRAVLSEFYLDFPDSQSQAAP